MLFSFIVGFVLGCLMGGFVMSRYHMEKETSGNVQQETKEQAQNNEASN